jgi:glycosyltransferase involved in cell wall biosynthesis
MLATHSGARTLPAVLNAFCGLESPEGGWKLVAVDNGSTDHTGEVIASFDQRLPLICVREPRRGKNIALNTGLASVSGDLVVFTDDDVLPNPLWLKQMRAAADSLSSFSIFGGPIKPQWEVPPEPWLLNWVPLDVAYSILKPMAEGPLKASFVFGPNMAIRASVLESGCRFDESIGPKGLNYPMGSETELLLRLAKQGFKAWHVENAIVTHMIRASQMDMRWVLQRASRFGRGRYRMETRESPEVVPRMFGMPRFMIRQILAQSLRVVRAKMAGDMEKLFKERWQLRYLIGTAIEARVMAKE